MELVSIITPLFNCENRIERTVSSVIEQSYKNWEMIIVDDCSSDESLKVAQRLSEIDSRIHVHTLEKNCGPAVARNYALARASGDYIAFLDSDDIWYKDKLEVQVNIMKEFGYPFTFTSYQRVDDKQRNLGEVAAPRKLSYRDLLKGRSIGCLTVMYDARLVGARQMPEILKRQDLGLWLCILRDFPEANGIPQVLAQYTVRPDSVSANKMIAAKYQWKLYREVEKINIFSSFYYFSIYAMSSVIKRFIFKSQA